MLILVSYDVSTTSTAGKKRLGKVAKTCSGFGVRVQYSMFECVLEPADWQVLKRRLLGIIDDEEDSLRFYYLGSNWKRRVEHHGHRKPPDIEDLLVV